MPILMTIVEDIKKGFEEGKEAAEKLVEEGVEKIEEVFEKKEVKKKKKAGKKPKKLSEKQVSDLAELESLETEKELDSNLEKRKKELLERAKALSGKIKEIE